MERKAEHDIARKLKVEKTGIHASQVINLKTMRVYSTIVDGKARDVLTGKVVREK